MRKVEPITARQLTEFEGRLVRSLEENGVNRQQFQEEFVQGFDGLMKAIFGHLTPNWLRLILEKECQYHKNFFGQEFDLSDFKSILKKYGLEAIERWQSLGLEPHYLPQVSMTQDVKFDGWKVKPESRYYREVAEGKILRKQSDGSFVVDEEPYKLEGISVLIDVRLKPKFNDGKQMFEDDNLLGPIIERLRKDGKIAKYEYGSQSSRFGVSANEWEKYIKPALAESLGVEVWQVRLERAIEANVIPQCYPDMPRYKDDYTNTWVWYEEYFEDDYSRLQGGYSLWGGLALVRYGRAGDHWGLMAVRPLVVLED